MKNQMKAKELKDKLISNKFISIRYVMDNIDIKNDVESDSIYEVSKVNHNKTDQWIPIESENGMEVIIQYLSNNFAHIYEEPFYEESSILIHTVDNRN